MAEDPEKVEEEALVVPVPVVVVVVDDCWGYPGEGLSWQMEERERLAQVVAHFRP